MYITWRQLFVVRRSGATLIRTASRSVDFGWAWFGCQHTHADDAADPPPPTRRVA